MEMRAIRSEEDYQWALKEIDQLMDATFGTPQGDRLDVLATLVDVYEKKNFPIEDPDPIEKL